MTKNQIDYMSLREEKRHNLASEEHNINVLNETKRSNLANETETLRSNQARERETYRSNKAREDETYRHNYVTEDLNLSNLSETKRHNLASERLSAGQIEESKRHNLAVEYLNSISTLADKAYKESQSLLRSQELDLAERRELQRISESLRDFNESVRRTDLQTLTSKGLVGLLQSLGLGATGLTAGTGAVLGSTITAGTTGGAVAGYLTGPTAKPKFVSAISALAKRAMIVPDMLLDLAEERHIAPNNKDQRIYY